MRKPKLDSTNSVWNYFGILAKVYQTGTMIVIESEDGQQRMMSRKKYRDSATRVYGKAQSLLGQEVEVRTSQSTKNWSEDKWFSDINIFNNA